MNPGLWVRGRVRQSATTLSPYSKVAVPQAPRGSGGGERQDEIDMGVPPLSKLSPTSQNQMWTQASPLSSSCGLKGPLVETAKTRPVRREWVPRTRPQISVLRGGREGEETASIFNKDPEVNLHRNISYFLLSVHLFLACCRPALRMSLGQVIIPKGLVLLGEGG